MIDTKSPISVLDLNTRAMNAIRRHTEIKTVEELISYDRELLYLPEIAKVTFAHIQEKLAEHNLYLQSDKRKIEMKEDILIGLCFVTYNSEGEREYQGRVLAKLENNVYLVQVYEWLFGSSSVMKLIPLEKLMTANLYNNLEELKKDNEIRRDR